ncbi:MAG TPA: F0F1 ATP synthase subunit A, partial [Ruminococcus sp.]|nr:F0F1 ATP synthase subunit A [Ruminococcus sp.]
MALPEFLQGSTDLNVSGPNIITSFEVFGITINFTETVVLEWI